MKDLKELKELVRETLKTQEETRDSDFKLVCWVYFRLKPDIVERKFWEVMWFHENYGLPSFETIRRTRQKLQHDNPELRGKNYEKRMEKQTEFIDAFVWDMYG